MRNNETHPDGPPATAGSLAFGERLRSARKARALSVEQVADALRLEQSSVVALEEERFDALGAPVFVRGHLRRYAQLVGLSEAAILEAYRSVAPDSDNMPSLTRPREQAEGFRVAPWVYWLAAIVVLVGIAMSLLSGDDEPAAPLPEAAPLLLPAAPESAAPAADVAQPAAAPPADVAPVVTSPSPDSQ